MIRWLGASFGPDLSHAQKKMIQNWYRMIQSNKQGPQLIRQVAKLLSKIKFYFQFLNIFKILKIVLIIAHQYDIIIENKYLINQCFILINIETREMPHDL